MTTPSLAELNDRIGAALAEGAQALLAYLLRLRREALETDETPK